VQAAVAGGTLRATMTPEPAEAFLIAVPTPFKGEDHEPDLSYIEAAAEAIAPVLEPGNIVILESTSPVGATEKLANWLSRARPDLTFPQSHGDDADIRVAYCPERVLPGRIMHELIENDRIIGGMSKRCSQDAVDLYRAFVTGECMVASGPRVAEMAKLSENSFRDVNIAFANELSLVCADLDVDVRELIGLANRHPRVNILQPGPGVGGHCIAVDPWFIVSSSPKRARLIRTAREVNDSKPGWVLDRIAGLVARFLADHPGRKKQDVTLACYGLAFKPDIDDLRESPAMKILASLHASFAGHLVVVEPNIDAMPAGFEEIPLVSIDEAERIADMQIVLVAHAPFHGTIRDKGYFISETTVLPAPS